MKLYHLFAVAVLSCAGVSIPSWAAFSCNLSLYSNPDTVSGKVTIDTSTSTQCKHVEISNGLLRLCWLGETNQLVLSRLDLANEVISRIRFKGPQGASLLPKDFQFDGETSNERMLVACHEQKETSISLQLSPSEDKVFGPLGFVYATEGHCLRRVGEIFFVAAGFFGFFRDLNHGLAKTFNR